MEEEEAGEFKMDLFKQKQIVTGLKLLIENSLDHIEKATDDSIMLRMNVSRKALDLAEQIGYFPQSELERLNTFYGIAKNYASVRRGLQTVK